MASDRNEPTEIRFEATNFAADANQEMGVLVMETEKQGHVAIHMQRAVFDALFERMRFALEQSTALDPDHSTD
jgi:hypothetical protein